LLSSSKVIGPEHLLLSPLALGEDEALPGAVREGSPAAQPAGGEKLEDVERNMLLGALRKSGWNITQAARQLGISRDTLRYRIEKYRLAPDA
jgi:transcriptional regulator of acetoin/glycerol metabolism